MLSVANVTPSLFNDSLKFPDGVQVQISQCPKKLWQDKISDVLWR